MARFALRLCSNVYYHPGESTFTLDFPERKLGLEAFDAARASCWVMQLRVTLWQFQMQRPGKDAVHRMFCVIQEGRLPLNRVVPVIGVGLRYASSVMAGDMFMKNGGQWVEMWIQADSRDIVVYRSKPMDCADEVGGKTTAYTSKRGSVQVFHLKHLIEIMALPTTGVRAKHDGEVVGAAGKAGQSGEGRDLTLLALSFENRHSVVTLRAPSPQAMQYWTDGLYYKALWLRAGCISNLKVTES